MNKNLKEALANLKKMLFEDAAPPADNSGADAAIEVKGKDGKVYKVAKLDVGEAIQVANETGELSPAPDGEIEAEDGSKITVKDGKIEAIKPAEAPKAEDPAPAAFDETLFVKKEDFVALTAQFTALNSTLETLSAALVANKGQISAMFGVVEALSGESDATPSDAPLGSAFKAAKTEKEIARAALKQAFEAAK